MPPRVSPSYLYPTIKEALDRVIEQKIKYEADLVGKKFLYVYVDKNNVINHKQMRFGRENFLHLTGLDYQSVQYSNHILGTKLPTDALNFYKRLGNDDTLINDVSFKVGKTKAETRRYYHYTQHKLLNLSQLTAITKKAEFIGKYNGNQNFDVLVNRNNNSIAFIADGGVHVPISSLVGKPQELATDIHKILAIFSCGNGQDFKLDYLNADVNISNKLFEKETLELLSPASFVNPKAKFNQQQLNALIHSYILSDEKYIKKALSELLEIYNDDNCDTGSYILKQYAFIKSLQHEFEINFVIAYAKEEMNNNPFYKKIYDILSAMQKQSHEQQAGSERLSLIGSKAVAEVAQEKVQLQTRELSQGTPQMVSPAPISESAQDIIQPADDNSISMIFM